MQRCFGYVRVSSKRQEDGVSLSEQRDAIAAYATANDIKITKWFTETVTAAKQGRPAFDQMLTLLSNGKADGLVIHKIDRSARNLHDWADLCDLADEGIAVFVAHEGLDLRLRGGRLSADIQAVVASDYIRNLKQEARKGFYGNLKKGLYPLGAPLGYLNHGKGKVKTQDPKRARLLREAFELYGSGRFGLHALASEMERRGLRTRQDRPVSVNALSKILRNPFYAGLIHIRSTNETFEGIHKPLISMALFQKVRGIAEGRLQTRVIKHGLLYRRLVTCASCHKTLIGERQKGHVYYRCHSKECPVKTAREEVVESAILGALEGLALPPELQTQVWDALDAQATDIASFEVQRTQTLRLNRDKLEARAERLTEGYLDRTISSEVYADLSGKLAKEKKALDEQQEGADMRQNLEQARRYLELAMKAPLSFQSGSDEDKRELVKLTTSNRLLSSEQLSVELSKPFSYVPRARGLSLGAHPRDVHRTDPTWASALVDRFLRWPLNH